MGIVLGLAAALLYGGGDFAGGLMSRRKGVLAVSLVGSLVSTPVVWLALLINWGPMPGASALAWGLGSGLAGGAGTLWLYRGLARGRISVVGPLSAVGAAVVPILLHILCGGSLPGWLAGAGIVLGIPAIALVASSHDDDPAAARGVGDGLRAGAAFGVLFFGLSRAGGHAGLWPIAGEQTGCLALLAAAHSPVTSAHRRGRSPCVRSRAGRPRGHGGDFAVLRGDAFGRTRRCRGGDIPVSRCHGRPRPDDHRGAFQPRPAGRISPVSVDDSGYRDPLIDPAGAGVVRRSRPYLRRAERAVPWRAFSSGSGGPRAWRRGGPRRCRRLLRARRPTAGRPPRGLPIRDS